MQRKRSRTRRQRERMDVVQITTFSLAHSQSGSVDWHLVVYEGPQETTFQLFKADHDSYTVVPDPLLENHYRREGGEQPVFAFSGHRDASPSPSNGTAAQEGPTSVQIVLLGKRLRLDFASYVLDAHVTENGGAPVSYEVNDSEEDFFV